MKRQDFFRLSLLAILLQACGEKEKKDFTNTSPSENGGRGTSTPTKPNPDPSLDQTAKDPRSITQTKDHSLDEDLESPSSGKASTSTDTSASSLGTPYFPNSKSTVHIIAEDTSITTTTKLHPNRSRRFGKVSRSLGPELEAAYQEGRAASSSSDAGSLAEVPRHKGYVLSFIFDDHSEKKIDVYVQNEKINQLKVQKTKLTDLMQGPTNSQQFKKIIAEEVPQIMEALINTSKIGGTNFQNCLGHTLKDSDNNDILATEDMKQALEKALKKLAKEITAEIFEVRDLIDDGGTDTSIEMRRSPGGEIDSTLYGDTRYPINLPIFVKMDKAAHAHNISNFMKVGQTLWGTRQKFNSQTHSLESLDLITNISLNKLFFEAKVKASKNTLNSNRSQYTFGWDFIKQGITPFLQVVSDTHNQIHGGVTLDVYKKHCNFFSYSMLATAKLGKITKENVPIFGTLNARGSIEVYNGLNVTSSLKLAPKHFEMTLSVGFSQ